MAPRPPDARSAPAEPGHSSIPPIRLVYYVNQFFGGIGGEERAGAPVEVVDAARGPAIGFVRELGRHGVECAAVTTVVCGDNYFTGQEALVVERVTALLRDGGAHLFVAGPAFLAGRYGVACARLAAAAESAGVPAVTGMSPENPGTARRGSALVVVTGETAGAMAAALSQMAALASLRLRGAELPSASDGGYLPRGRRRQIVVEHSAAERAVAMVRRLLAGEPAASEIPMPKLRPDHVVTAPPVPDLSRATIALVCEGGLVPRGNPDRIPTGRASNWAMYPIPREGLRAGDYEVSHGGIDSRWGTEEPNRLVPYDAALVAQGAGRVGRVLDKYLVTTGNGGRLQDMTRIAREMAERLRAEGADAVVLTGT